VPCTIRLLADLHTQGLDKPIPETTCGTLDDNCVVTFVLEGVERRVRLNPYRLHRLVEVVAPNGDGIPMDCAPDEDELERLVCDSICPSLTGESVEPDGHDSHGAPSWMLLLGLV
jgi:hypothetical protein